MTRVMKERGRWRGVPGLGRELFYRVAELGFPEQVTFKQETEWR